MLGPALEYAERKFCVFPCWPRTKKPIPKNGFKAATIDVAKIETWWTENPDANIAIACAMSNIVVLDIDVPCAAHSDLKISGEDTLAALVEELGGLPEAPISRTGAGGRHLFFLAPAGAEFKTALGPGVEIKSAGYVMVAPSVHPDTGEQWRWIISLLARMPAPLPETWLAAMVKTTVTATAAKAATPTPVARTTIGCSAYGRAAVERVLERVRATPKGERNIELFKASAALSELYAGGEIDDVRDELVAAVVAPDFTKREARTTVESGWRKGGDKPRRAPPREGKPVSTPTGKIAKIAKIAVASPGNAEWPEPQPLVASVPRESYPVGALPPIFREAIAEVQTFVQAPVAMVAMSALGAASIAVQALAHVERAEGLAGPVGLYSIAVALSGERKTTVDKYFAEPIRDYEQAKAEECEPLVKSFKADFAAWEAQMSGLEEKIKAGAKAGKDVEDDKQRLREIAQDEPKPPMVPQLLYTDATYEALAYALVKRWPSGGILCSEAGTVFGAHSMGKDTIMRTLGLWNNCWDGGPIKIDRRATGTSFYGKNSHLTMHLQVQPDVLLDFLETDRGLARGIGFFARTLIACPESTQGSRLFREPPKSWPALSRFNKRISEILNMPVSFDESGTLTPAVLSLTTDARSAWIRFHDGIECELKIGGTLVDVRDVASKCADNATRIAAILHVVEHGLGAVGLPAFESAAQIAEWHLTEARSFFGEVVQPEENVLTNRLESWLVEYCRRRGVSSVPISTIQNSGPSKLRPRLALETTLAALAELGRARLVQPHGKAKVVEINPALLATAIIANPAIIAQSTKKAVI
jgi:hypothetical protein